jgi:hypothetical protein
VSRAAELQTHRRWTESKNSDRTKEAAGTAIHPLAVLAAISALLWMFWVGSCLAILLGHGALILIKRSQRYSGGKLLAQAAIAMGVVELLPLLLFYVLVFIRAW